MNTYEVDLSENIIKLRTVLSHEVGDLLTCFSREDNEACDILFGNIDKICSLFSKLIETEKKYESAFGKTLSQEVDTDELRKDLIERLTQKRNS